MTLSRDELAARFAVPLIQEQCRALHGKVRDCEIMPTAFGLADAFLAESTKSAPTKCPVCCGMCEVAGPPGVDGIRFVNTCLSCGGTGVAVPK